MRNILRAAGVDFWGEGDLRDEKQMRNILRAAGVDFLGRGIFGTKNKQNV